MKKTVLFLLMCCASFYALAQSIPPVSDPHCAYCNVNLRTATSHKSGCPYYVEPSSTSSEAYSSSGGKIFVPLVIIDRGSGLVSCCPWVHIAIANAKRLLLDVYHDIRPEYLQNYLNEFCWKFNRRNFGEALFDRLMVATVSYKNQFRYNIE